LALPRDDAALAHRGDGESASEVWFDQESCLIRDAGQTLRQLPY
jgi:hypothetical protein